MASELEPRSAQREPASGAQQLRSYRPQADIAESAQEYFIHFDMPGVEADGLEIRVEQGVLTVDGRISLDGYAKLTPVYTEQGLGHFRRTFQLGSAVDTEKIDAQLRDGVLQLVLPKRGAAHSRRIEVLAA